MSNNYKVTIAIPVYNVEKYVERALLSALNQTFNDIEFLVVDDKGQDKSMDIIYRIISEHPRGKHVRVIDHLVNKSIGAVRNTSIEEAKGEYLYFMDSDDEITPDCIEKLYNKIKEHNVDFVASSCVHKGIDGTVLPFFKPYKDRLYISKDGENIIDYIYLQNLPINVTVWNKLYNIKFLRENNIRCIPNHLTEDITFSFQIYLKAKSCFLLSDITYIYYVIPNSTTDNASRTKEKSERIAKEHIEILEYKRSVIDNNRNKEWYYKAIKGLIAESYFYVYWVIKSKIDNKKYFVEKMISIPFSEYKPFWRDKTYISWILNLCPYNFKRILLWFYYRKFFKY